MSAQNYRLNPAVHFLASDVRRAIETCPLPLAGQRRGGELQEAQRLGLTAPRVNYNARGWRRRFEPGRDEPMRL
jgi:hypothetical protein